MLLRLSNFEHGGNTFEEAFAQIGSISFDPKSGIAWFSVAVYSNQAATNKITDLVRTWVKPSFESGAKPLPAQCYDRLIEMTNTELEGLAARRTELDAMDENSDARQVGEMWYGFSSRSPILKLSGSTLIA